MRFLFIISAESKGLQTVEKSDVSSSNNFAKDSKLSGRSFIYTKKSKGPSIEPCGTPARIGDQFEDWPLRTTLWSLSVRKLWKSLCKLLELPTVSSLYSNPSCQTLPKAFEIFYHILAEAKLDDSLTCTVYLPSYEVEQCLIFSTGLEIFCTENNF